MAEFKLNIGDPKSKKTLKKEIKDDEAEVFLGKKIGDKVSGKDFGHDGYEFEITGGSDHIGLPMRRDVQGVARKKILIVSGTGIRKNRDGRKVRRTMAGNTVFSKTSQINLKVLKYGKTPLFEEEKPAEEPAKEEKKEAPAEKQKEEKAPVKKEEPKPQKEEKSAEKKKD